MVIYFYYVVKVVVEVFDLEMIFLCDGGEVIVWVFMYFKLFGFG